MLCIWHYNHNVSKCYAFDITTLVCLSVMINVTVPTAPPWRYSKPMCNNRLVKRNESTWALTEPISFSRVSLQQEATEEEQPSPFLPQRSVQSALTEYIRSPLESNVLCQSSADHWPLYCALSNLSQLLKRYQSIYQDLSERLKQIKVFTGTLLFQPTVPGALYQSA